ncbi:hypothetical protein V6C27_03930 [Peptococcaceae bacterium 1198_IL3148]
MTKRIRCESMAELEQFLNHSISGQLDFRAYPIAGNPEDFHYNQHEQVVVRKKDGRQFDNVEDFLCYAFQCDLEGYAHTEHVDVETIN